MDSEFVWAAGGHPFAKVHAFREHDGTWPKLTSRSRCGLLSWAGGHGSASWGRKMPASAPHILCAHCAPKHGAGHDPSVKGRFPTPVPHAHNAARP